MKSISILLVLAHASWLGIMACEVVAQDLPQAGVAIVQPVTAQDSTRLAALITQLESNSFSVREAASAELLAFGELALPNLRTISNSAPFEVRHRAELIRERIEDDKFASLSRSFLLDLNGDNSYGLPAWDKYRELVGASRSSKLLFLEMIREQPELARLIEVVSVPTPSRVAVRTLESLASMEAVRLREEIFALREPHLGDAVAMLLVAATVPHQTPIEISEIIVSNERRAFGGHVTQQGYASTAGGHVAQPGYGNCLRKLMSAWLPKTHQSMAPTAMDCALRYDLSEGLEIARRHLTANFDSDTRKLAFYCLARFGNETDLPLLLPLLNDQKVVDEFARSAIEGEIHVSNAAPPGIPPAPVLSNNMVVRINDLAITTAMLLLAEDPSEFYPRFETHAKLGFFIHSLAAPPESVEQQQQRIDQWKQQHQPRQIES